MTNIELMEYWIQTSDEDYDTMKVLYNSNKYSWSLFVGHLVIEKLLKGLYAKNNKNNPYAPKSHDLLYLANKLNIKTNEKIDDLLDTITRFNINGRYDDYKREFYSRCTKEYTTEQIKNIEEVRRWLKGLLM